MLTTSTARRRVDADGDGHHYPRSVRDRKDRCAGGVAMSFLQFHGNSLNMKHVLDEDEKLCRHRVTKGRTHRRDGVQDALRTVLFCAHVTN